MLLTIILSSGCDGRSDHNPVIKAHAFYETKENPGVRIADVGARVFFYNKIQLTHFINHQYSGNGIFTLEDTTSITPNEEHVIGDDGSATFVPRIFSGEATLVIESNYYQGEIVSACFSSIVNGAGLYKVFMPK
jgi:hypothetical protein